MNEFEFTLAINGPIGDEIVIDNLFEAGCADATFGEIDGAGYGDFSRAAKSFADAVTTGIRDVESVRGLRVTRVEPDDLVTQAEIAERLGRSRESVRLLIAGERGPGDFPAPLSHLGARSRVWRWSEVAAWSKTLTSSEIARARFVSAINAALDLRRLGDLTPAERRVTHRYLSAVL